MQPISNGNYTIPSTHLHFPVFQKQALPPEGSLGVTRDEGASRGLRVKHNGNPHENYHTEQTVSEAQVC